VILPDQNLRTIYTAVNDLNKNRMFATFAVYSFMRISLLIFAIKEINNGRLKQLQKIV
jgi:hypothetical protein